MENLKTMTNEELRNYWYEQDDYYEDVEQAIAQEVTRRLANGTMKSEISNFPTDWELFVDCCKD